MPLEQLPEQPIGTSPKSRPLWGPFGTILVSLGGLIIIGVFAWQGITAKGVADPLAHHTKIAVASIDIGVLIFREGLEFILVLSALTAGLTGSAGAYRRPITLGAVLGSLATLATWLVTVRIVDDLSENVSALDLQAATGLLAVVVLLTVMNWFFHKIYWGGWISMHNRRKRELLSGPAASRTGLWWGLGLLGFTSLYREGFEVVLFLQSYRLRLGGEIVLAGTVLGLLLTGAVAVLNFWAHRRLPYRKMLVLTGLMLGVVLLVMVGEQAQEMQLAHWLPTTPIEALGSLIPGWMELWFAVFPTVETISAQLIAGMLVVGSYLLATRQSRVLNEGPG